MAICNNDYLNQIESVWKNEERVKAFRNAMAVDARYINEKIINQCQTKLAEYFELKLYSEGRKIKNIHLIEQLGDYGFEAGFGAGVYAEYEDKAELTLGRCCASLLLMMDNRDLKIETMQGNIEDLQEKLINEKSKSIYCIIKERFLKLIGKLKHEEADDE